jgi:prolyl 4-hydroxylase
MYFALYENPIISHIEKRISDITNTPVENGEGMQVVFYKPGGYLKPHWDDFDTYFEVNKAQLNRAAKQ